MIKPGQIYQTCYPTHVVDGEEKYTRIKVLARPVMTHGLHNYGKVMVATITETGREVRPRPITLTSLHKTNTTRYGLPRTSGYHLVQDV